MDPGAARILVTGNMGYIGPCVVEHLRESRPDAELVGLDTGFFAQCLTGTTLLPERRLDCQYFGDVRAVPAGALQGVDGVVHLAGVSNDPIGTSFEAATLDVNHRATVSLARAAKEAGARSFVFASSCSVYGLAEDGLRTEQSETGPLTAYATSKLLAERDLAELADETFAVTSLRFATACGMTDRLRLDLVLNDFVAGAHAFREITLSERRHAVAAAYPRPRHGPRDRLGARAAGRPRRSLPRAEHRLRRVELPDPAARGRGRLHRPGRRGQRAVRTRLRIRAPTR